MKFNEVKAELRNYGMTIKREKLGSYSHEYRVNFIGGTEESAYYTDDLRDASDTGRAMATAKATQCGVSDSHKDD